MTQHLDTRFEDQTFEQVLRGTLHNLANKIFAESQTLCPVKSGNLKASGSVKNYPSGEKVSVIEYTVPYADMVNRTQRLGGQRTDGTKRVPEHTRTYPSSKRVTVKEHKKNTDFRPERRGKGFLTQAEQNVLDNFDRFMYEQFPTSAIVVKSYN